MLAAVQAAGATTTSKQINYYSDGLVQSRWYSPLNAAISRQYTSAGRETSRQDPLFNETTSYDAYGRVSGRGFYDGQSFSNFAFGNEGEIASYAATASYNLTNGLPTETIAQQFTADNQLAQNGIPYLGNTTNWYFDGVPIPLESGPVDPNSGNGYDADPIIDTRNLLVVGLILYSPGGGDFQGLMASYYYDNDGRIVGTNGYTTVDRGQSSQIVTDQTG